MIFWVHILVIATNFWFATFFFRAAVSFAQAGEYAMCAVEIIVVALSGGVATSALCKLLK